jgi:hypothetical protein
MDADGTDATNGGMGNEEKVAIAKSRRRL